MSDRVPAFVFSSSIFIGLVFKFVRKNNEGKNCRQTETLETQKKRKLTNTQTATNIDNSHSMEDVIKIDKFRISPDSIAPLKAPLTLEMEYQLATPIADGVWDLVYVADYTQKRLEIPLHQTAVGAMSPGLHAYSHTLEAIPIDGVKEKYLLQVGLLKLTLRDQKGTGDDANVASINMVVQVSKDATGTLVRNVMSPLDE